MSKIVDYIFNMLPYMLIATPLYILIRLFVWRRFNKINWYREILMFLFIIFMIGLASLTVIPKLEFVNGKMDILNDRIGGVNLIPFIVLFETYIEVFKYGNIDYFIINFLGNIIMFIPIGFCVPLLWEVKDKNVIFIGFLTSLFIEVSQLFLNRGTDVDDLILNTLGVLLGLLICKVLVKRFRNFFEKFKV